jgi:hypothetical protein
VALRRRNSFPIDPGKGEEFFFTLQWLEGELQDNGADVEMVRRSLREVTPVCNLTVATGGTEALDRLFQRGRFSKYCQTASDSPGSEHARNERKRGPKDHKMR